MAAFTPSIHVFLGRPLFFLSSGIRSIINFQLFALSEVFVTQRITFCHNTLPLSHKVYEMEGLKFHWPLTSFQSDNDLGLFLQQLAV
jgi:hypothetical protein